MIEHLKKLRLITVPACLVCVLGLVCVSGYTSLAVADEQNELPLDDLQMFVDVFSKIKNDYVDTVEDSELLRDAIRGMLGGLDPHSTFLESEDYKEMRHGTEGKFGGLGIEVSTEDGFIKVVAPIDDTPAADAGLEAGDLIIRIDGELVKGMSLRDAVDKMRGLPGTQIDLTISRKGKNKPIEVTLTRAVIKVASVKSRLFEDKFGYIRIASFQNDTGENLRSKIEALKEQSSDGIKGLILDLRNNPGGVLSDAIEVSDAFIKQGVIVSTRGRDKETNVSYSATPNDILDDAPLVVLVNNGSASASEIVAGALQDHKRAIIMGTRTFGKGSVQTVIPLTDGAALKITTARYYTPDDRTIQATGINPDIIIDQVDIVARERAAGVREADLSGHLENENGDEDEDQTKTTVEEKDDGDAQSSSTDAADLADSDFQIREALNLLKGMSLVKLRAG